VKHFLGALSALFIILALAFFPVLAVRYPVHYFVAAMLGAALIFAVLYTGAKP